MALNEVSKAMNVAFPGIACTISCPRPGEVTVRLQKGCCYTNSEVRRLLQKHLSPDVYLRVVR